MNKKTEKQEQNVKLLFSIFGTAILIVILALIASISLLFGGLLMVFYISALIYVWHVANITKTSFLEAYVGVVGGMLSAIFINN